MDPFKTIMRQSYSIPSTIINYILQRDNEILLQKSQEFPYKICSLCKYFFTKLRLISCYQLSIESDHIELRGYTAPRHMRSITFQCMEKTNVYFCPTILTTDTLLNLYPNKIERAPPTIVSKFLPKLCNYRIKYLSLKNQEMTLEEFIFLTRNCKCEVLFYDCKINEKNGNIVPAEKLLEVSPNLLQFAMRFDKITEMCYSTPLTSKKLAAFPKFKYLIIFFLHNVSDNFKASDFIEFINKNHKNGKLTTFGIKFLNDVSPIFIHTFKKDIDAAMHSIKDVEDKKVYFDGREIAYSIQKLGS